MRWFLRVFSFTGKLHCVIIIFALFLLRSLRKRIAKNYSFIRASQKKSVAVNFFLLSHSKPSFTIIFIKLNTWLAGWACKQNSLPNLWRNSRLLAAVVNSYSLIVVEFSANHAVLRRAKAYCMLYRKSHSTLKRRRHWTCKEAMNNESTLMSLEQQVSIYLRKYRPMLLQKSKQTRRIVSYESLARSKRLFDSKWDLLMVLASRKAKPVIVKYFYWRAQNILLPKSIQSSFCI